MTPASSESLSHAKWDGTSHVVLIPTGRQTALEDTMRRVRGPGWRAEAGQRGSPILAGHRGQDHGPRRIRMPPP